MKIEPYIYKHLAAGVVAGCIISITPLLLLLIVLIVILILFIRSLMKAGSRNRRLAHIISITICIACVQLASWLPIKPFDRSIQTLDYPPMPISALAETIEKDCGIRIDVRGVADKNAIIAFRTDGEMSLRDMLTKLADDTGHTLNFTYCPNNATFLWGIHPHYAILTQQNKSQQGN